LQDIPRFADDIIAISENEHDLQLIVNKTTQESFRMGKKIMWRKPRYKWQQKTVRICWEDNADAKRILLPP